MKTQKELAAQYAPGERITYRGGSGLATHTGEIVSIGADGILRVNNGVMLVSVNPGKVLGKVEKTDPANAVAEPAAESVVDQEVAKFPDGSAVGNDSPIAELKAITIVQPYASLIALPNDHPAAKRVENRTWTDNAPAETPKDETVRKSPPAPDHFVPSVDQWEAIVDATREAQDLAAHVEQKKEELSAAKKESEKAAERLIKLINEARTPNLFSPRVAPSTPAEIKKVEDSITNPITEAPAPVVDDEAWKAIPVIGIGHGIDEKIATMLADAGILTFGQLEKWRGNRFEPKVKGFGAKKMEVIEEAVVAYWMANPQPAKKVEAAGPTLAWAEAIDGSWVAPNSAGLINGDGNIGTGKPFEYEICKCPEGWEIVGDACLFPPGDEAYVYETVEGAKNAAELLNAALVADKAKATPAPAPAPRLVWTANPHDDFRQSAVNTAGIYCGDSDDNGSPVLASFRINVVSENRVLIDDSDDELLPNIFPNEFRTEEEAKAYCEDRNAALPAEQVAEPLAAAV